MKTNPEDSAFALMSKYGVAREGISKREYFAGIVLKDKTGSPTELANYAVRVADELIKELNKENEDD